MKAVLFDLDGTLLDIDIDAFISTYFRALAPVVAEVVGGRPEQGVAAVMSATRAMMAPHLGRTNADVFAISFAQATGVELGPSHWERFDAFYSEVFPTLRGDTGPSEGAHEAVAVARALGLKTVVATNPIFPEAAIRERLRWAGLENVPFDLVTTYESSQAAKPDLAYYRAIATAMESEPDECIMVGDDPALDMVAADIGMITFYTGPEPAPPVNYRGTLMDLTWLLPRLIGAGVDV